MPVSYIHADSKLDFQLLCYHLFKDKMKTWILLRKMSSSYQNKTGRRWVITQFMEKPALYDCGIIKYYKISLHHTEYKPETES